MLLNSAKSLLLSPPTPSHNKPFHNLPIIPARSGTEAAKLTRFKFKVSSASSGNPTNVVVPVPPQLSEKKSTESAADVVRSFYNGINRHDLASVENLIAENCVYEDLIFSSPFVGRKAILEFFEKFTGSVSTELQFVIDEISLEDSVAVGVTWHLEWKGKEFPFSRGCSYYRLEVVDGIKQIVYGRDAVEPAIKPGEAALVAIRGVAWLLKQFPWLGDRL